MRSAFIIYKRGKVFYARFVNPDGKKFTDRSINVLYTSLHGIGRVKINKAQAKIVKRIYQEYILQKYSKK